MVNFLPSKIHHLIIVQDVIGTCLFSFSVALQHARDAQTEGGGSKHLFKKNRHKNRLKSESDAIEVTAAEQSFDLANYDREIKLRRTKTSYSRVVERNLKARAAVELMAKAAAASTSPTFVGDGASSQSAAPPSLTVSSTRVKRHETVRSPGKHLDIHLVLNPSGETQSNQDGGTIGRPKLVQSPPPVIARQMKSTAGKLPALKASSSTGNLLLEGCDAASPKETVLEIKRYPAYHASNANDTLSMATKSKTSILRKYSAASELSLNIDPTEMYFQTLPRPAEKTIEKKSKTVVAITKSLEYVDVNDDQTKRTNTLENEQWSSTIGGGGTITTKFYVPSSSSNGSISSVGSDDRQIELCRYKPGGSVTSDEVQFMSVSSASDVFLSSSTSPSAALQKHNIVIRSPRDGRRYYVLTTAGPLTFFLDAGPQLSDPGQPERAGCSYSAEASLNRRRLIALAGQYEQRSKWGQHGILTGIDSENIELRRMDLEF